MDSSESELSEGGEIAFPPVFDRRESDSFKFLGRDWLFSKLTKHMNGYTSHKNTILLLGGIGTGKTCLLRQLVQTSEFKNQTLAYYECDENSDDCSFVLQLVRQLKRRIPYLKVPSYLQLEKDKQASSKGEYSSNESLFNEIDQEDDRFFRQRKAKTQSDIFWDYFLFPLIEHGLNRWEEERYLVLIDSVDLKTEIFELIVKHLHLIPKYLFLILSARPKRQADLFKKFVDSRKFQIDDMRKQYILTDMKCYVHHQLERLKYKKQLKEYTAKVMINQLAIKSNGCYYFIRLFVDYVEKEIFNPETDLNLGCTIHGLFLQAFAKLFSDKDRKVQLYYKSILSLVLASQANQLNKSILNLLFINPTHIDNCLKELEFFQLIYLTYNEDGDTLINLTAYPLQAWLNDIKLASRRYFCNANFGHLLLINVTPNIAVEQYCYQIDKSDFPVFDLEHKLIWLLLEIDHQQLNLLDSQSSEVARDLCVYRSRLHKTHHSFDEIYRHLFTTNLFYDEFARQYTAESSEKERSSSLINLQTKQPRMLTVGISAVEQRVLSTFSKLTLKSIEPEERDEKKINFDFDVFGLLKAAENLDLQQLRAILNGNPDLVNKYVDDDPLLFYAIKTESKQLIELLIEFNVDVNMTSEYDKQTALMLATQLNLIEIALILLENDADVDALNKFGQSAIVYAILYKSKPRLTELLLFWGANLDYLDNDHKTLLLMSCVNSDSDLETVRLLIGCGQNLYHQDKFGKSVLHLAAVHGNYELIEYLVEIGREELVCLKDSEAKLPIHYGVIYGQNQVLPLLACERSINSISVDGCSPLRTAAFEFQYDCLHTLIDCCGADVNSVDNNGRSVLYALALKSNDNPDVLEMMKELIKLHANLELCASENKTTVLHVACFMSFEQTVALLLSAGAEVNAVDIEQRTALHLVCASTGNTNIMRKLIEHGIEIDARTIHGATSLMFAAQQGQYDACKLLLEFGANVWLRDEYGASIRDILISCNYGLKMRKLFEKYFGIIGNSDYDVSSAPDPAKNPAIFSDACSPISNNNPNLSSTNDLAFNLSIDKEDGGGTCNSMQGEGRSWIADSVDNLASYAGSGQNLSTCSPMQSAFNINYFNSANNLKANNLIGGSHNHLVAANPKLLSPNFRAESFDQVTKKDKRTNKISSMGNKLSRFLH